ncbi:MAG: hypothetical protein AUI14_06250 [Actinobacteria bacterium 13_2_20CM_2_71_6]|nr:MAG: hypothetical protein AUI14_06250 [Actinobacteria bacterium 13_2_20CM_2_71_6]
MATVVDSADAVRTLRDAGLRVTSQRVAVVGVLAEGGHVDVETLTSKARERLGTLTSQAVYEMLPPYPPGAGRLGGPRTRHRRAVPGLPYRRTGALTRRSLPAVQLQR